MPTLKKKIHCQGISHHPQGSRSTIIVVKNLEFRIETDMEFSMSCIYFVLLKLNGRLNLLALILIQLKVLLFVLARLLNKGGR
jgi:hypothetical protein